MKISFYGAAREVTGSCFLLETGSTKVLVDCGMFQGPNFADEKNHTDFLFNPKEIDAVLLTHAHVDHTGRVPRLVHEGFKGKIFATTPTQKLAKIIWDDALHIMGYEQKKLGREVLYHEDDVEKANNLFQTVKYGQKKIIKDIKAVWHDAGHILGSGFIEIEAEGKKIVFSGDLGNTDIPILRPLEKLPNAHAVFMESTYGGHLHEDPKGRVQLLRACIMKAIEKRGVLLIPAFSIERTQEILYELDELAEQRKIPKVPIFVDSPMAIRATRVFMEEQEFYDREALERIGAGDDLFNFPGLQRTLSKSESKRINKVKPPKVIIAGAGMMTGGRIIHHAQRYLQDKRTTLLFVGYQAEGTLGREILNGAKEVKIYKNLIDVRANVERLGAYSDHADREHLVQWVKSSEKLPKKVFLIHGEPDSQEILAKQIKKETGIVSKAPEFGSSVSL